MNYLSPCWSRWLLLVHLMLAVFTLGVVTHHGWLVVRKRGGAASLSRYATWTAIAYPLALLVGILIYPTYNVHIRKPPLGVLENSASWAVGLFEIKEHVASIAIAMLPLLVLAARYYEKLDRLQRMTYMLATCLFTIFVYYTFIAGALVTTLRSF